MASFGIFLPLAIMCLFTLIQLAKGKYQVLRDHRACDSVGAKEVTSVQDCRRAAQFLGLRYVGTTRRTDLARNCWRNSRNQVCFNYNQNRAVSRARGNTWAICQRGVKKEEVSCGGHKANNCACCPQGNGAAWCSGECVWIDKQCVSIAHGGAGSSAELSCGGHKAKSCGGCPQGRGASWCSGDCYWKDNKCQFAKCNKDEAPKPRPRPGGTGTGTNKKEEVSCGGHKANNCGCCPQGNGAAWCGGECTWRNNQCVSKAHGGAGSSAELSCGGHNAKTCGGCPQGRGASWCSGDCVWKDNKCQFANCRPP